MLRPDGYLHCVQLHRLTTTKKFEMAFNICRKTAKDYRTSKERFETIPKEKRHIPFFIHGHIAIVIDNDLGYAEIIENVEEFLKTLKAKWKAELGVKDSKSKP